MMKFQNVHFWNFALRILAGGLLRVLLLLVSTGELIAAANDITKAQSDAENFSRVLGRSLELNQGNEIFGMSIEGVSATYLHNQGLLLELRTPLAKSRNTLNLASIGSRLSENSGIGNPFTEFALRNEFPIAGAEPRVEIDDVAQGLTSSTMVERLYDGLTIRMTSIEYSMVVQTALRQASTAIQSMRELDVFSDSDAPDIQNEISDLRDQLSNNVEIFGSIEQRAGSGSLDGVDLIAETDAAIASMESLKIYSISFAKNLMMQSAEAEKDYNARWETDLKAFEIQMYSGLCEHVGLLFSFSDSEYLTLQVLGVSKDANGFIRDKFHTLRLAEIRRCAAGEIDVEGMSSNAVSYTNSSNLRSW
ncbi:MAG: hypothetical protein P8J52_00045 [Gammaproteobacteria bacterium]|nr:hypothetical protein [Gammaproteobacteria bacterium]